MKNCSCGKPVEVEHYEMCYSCWFVNDTRQRERVLQYLRDMTEIARTYDIIIAEPIESAPFTYDPQYGSKLYWNNHERKYVFVNPDDSIVG